MKVDPANRTYTINEYYFSRKNREIDELNRMRVIRGEDRIINLGSGNPDCMPPANAIRVLTESAQLNDCHGYQNYKGLADLRESFAIWYKRYYGVYLDPSSEIQPLTGSKEGILLTTLAFVNPGEKVLIPDPGYPTYTSATLLAGAEPVKYDLNPDLGWLPNFNILEKMDLSGVKLMWTNYPNMPTGAKASIDLYQNLVDFGRRHNILIVNDNPYSFILNDQPLSIFEIEGAKECCLEMNSLSKSHNMAGWRIGMVAGDSKAISLILKVKSQMDSGIFKPLQLAAIEALGQGPEWFKQLNAEYCARREAAGHILDAIGAKYSKDSSGLFLWGYVGNITQQKGKTRGEIISDKCLYDAGVFITPGFIFGQNGNDYVRVTICAPVPILEEAAQRIRNLAKY